MDISMNSPHLSCLKTSAFSLSLSLADFLTQRKVGTTPHPTPIKSFETFFVMSLITSPQKR